MELQLTSMFQMIMYSSEVIVLLFNPQHPSPLLNGNKMWNFSEICVSAVSGYSLLLISFLTLVLAFILLGQRAVPQNVPPGSFGWPLLGETLSYLRTQREGIPEAFYQERIRKYGRVFTTSLIGKPTVVFCSQKGNRVLYSNENKLVVMSWPKSVTDLVHNSLFVKTGNEARKLRQVLMTFLRPEALQNFIGRADSMTKAYLSKFWSGRDQVTVFPLAKKFTFSLACNLFASIDSEEEVDELEGPFNDFLKALLQLPIDLPGTRFRKGKIATEVIRAKLDVRLRERKEALQKGESSPTQDLLSYLICNTDEDGKALSDNEIKQNILMLLFAGHDTSSRVIPALLKLLAENPDCYQKVLEEQLEVAKSKKAGEFLQWEDLQKMKYSWRAVQESLRLHPPVQGSFRKVINEFEFEGYRIPEGWTAYCTVNSTHRNPEYFKEPDRFDPDRFEEGPPPYAFIPFGGGSRICPGMEFARMEILVFIHNLVTQFRWELMDPNEKMIIDPMPAPAHGLPVKLFPRCV